MSDKWTSPDGAIVADTLDWSRQLANDSVDLVFCSPPYEAQRTYGIGFNLKGQAWVDWAVERFVEHVRICRGLVCWVVEGFTRKFQWSASPALLMADLHRRGIRLRKPPVFHRVGVCGSGGPDWLRNDFEFIVCASKGKLPWSNNVAMGHKPKWSVGGEMSHRLSDGSRRNQWGGGERSTGGERQKNGIIKEKKPRPSHSFTSRSHTKRVRDSKSNGGDVMREQSYTPPVLANPGNVIKCVVGGGCMGSKMAHENEAPFPEKLAEFFVRSFCPPSGTVYDAFCGSGTTLAVAKRTGRIGIGTDVRESQIELTRRRLASVQVELFADDAKETA